MGLTINRARSPGGLLLAAMLVIFLVLAGFGFSPGGAFAATSGSVGCASSGSVSASLTPALLPDATLSTRAATMAINLSPPAIAHAAASIDAVLLMQSAGPSLRDAAVDLGPPRYHVVFAFVTSRAQFSSEANTSAIGPPTQSLVFSRDASLATASAAITSANIIRAGDTRPALLPAYISGGPQVAFGLPRLELMQAGVNPVGTGTTYFRAYMAPLSTGFGGRTEEAYGLPLIFPI